MPSLFPEPGPVEVAVSVSSYLQTLNGALGEYGAIVLGEVTEARSYPSGIYFAIKDATGAEGVLNCYLSPYKVRMFGHLITPGTELRIAGVPRIAARKGSFAFAVEAIELAGAGALRAAYEELKKKLEAEGLFDRELPIPTCTKRIGIVTSRAGAVIDDFRKNLDKRGYQLLMHDARVEGVRAVPSILAAIEWFRAHENQIDLLVVMRGGGSLEDLQAFNNESVARAVASLSVPVIAAIGHDRDVPIANMAADVSTSTPSIAALQINRSWEDADRALALGTERIMRGAQGIVHGLHRRLDLATERLAGRSRALVGRATERVTRASQTLAGYVGKLQALPDEQFGLLRAAFTSMTQRLTDRLLAVERELAIVDPQRTLRLGYSIITGSNGQLIRNVAQATVGETLRARLTDGVLTATITDAHKED